MLLKSFNNFRKSITAEFLAWPLSMIICIYLYFLDIKKILPFFRQLEESGVSSYISYIESPSYSYIREMFASLSDKLFYYHYEMFSIELFQDYLNTSPTHALLVSIIIKISLLLAFIIVRSGNLPQMINSPVSMLTRFFLVFCIVYMTIQIGMIMSYFNKIYVVAYFIIVGSIAGRIYRKISLHHYHLLLVAHYIKAISMLYLVPFIFFLMYMFINHKVEINQDAFAVITKYFLIFFMSSVFFHYLIKLTIKKLSLPAEKLLSRKDLLHSRSLLFEFIIVPICCAFLTVFACIEIMASFHVISGLLISLVLIVTNLFMIFLMAVNLLLVLKSMNNGLLVSYNKFGKVEESIILKLPVDGVTKLYGHLCSYFWLYCIVITFADLGVLGGIYILGG